MNWWPELFPCRAAFAAVRLATRGYIPAKSRNGFVTVERVGEDACHGRYLIVFGRASVLMGCVRLRQDAPKATTPSSLPMLLDKEAARQAALNAECIRLMRLDNPGMPQFDTLNKDLLKAWCKHNNIRGVSSKSKNELRDMCLLKLRKKVEAPRHM
ncbi:hypothetical protein QJQ45_020159 [Haematococcus lacustris]|nr:hypothetical protein QJQ45_020159 [Haematococcus lacustris]